MRMRLIESFSTRVFAAMPKLSRRLTPFLLLLALISNAFATITLYSASNAVIGTIQNTDPLYVSNNYTLTGSIGVATFQDPATAGACKLKQPTNYTVLLVPISALMAAGCGVDSVVIAANAFMVPGPNLPGVVVFMSTNGGEPGYKEYVLGATTTLDMSIPGVTLVTAVDFFGMMGRLQTINHVTITSNPGPWFALRYSTALYAYIIALSPSFLSAPRVGCPASNDYGFTLEYSTASLNYADLADVMPFWLSFAILTLSAYTFIAIVYVYVLYSWVEVCSKLNLDGGGKHIPKIATAYRFLCIITVILYVLAFILTTIVGTASGLPAWFSPMLNVVNILKYIGWALVPVGFLIFGIVLVTSLRRTISANTSSRTMSNKILILMITMGTAQILWLIANYIAINATTTVRNFWIARVAGDFTNIVSSIILIVVLGQTKLISGSSPANSRSTRSTTKTPARSIPMDQFDISGSKRHTWTKMGDQEIDLENIDNADASFTPGATQ
ncbi:hypothetical protein BC938DRAFT_474572 [Jimgerdemannia flammicorona]|uniref:Uncharacterized protein n=1 Tax=Jimgerdemannia flammicorona TaxID=994334 RepID=A0A433QSE3_9FUNG|nr:hypothetical protein BC938DRAFT_474572 [Jimgerdemannia flammicorona]